MISMFLSSSLTASIVVFLISIWYLVSGRWKMRDPLLAPKVPYMLPFLGSALSLSNDAQSLFTNCRHRFGPIFNLYIAGRWTVFVIDARYFKDLYKNHDLSFTPVSMELQTKLLGCEPSTLKAIASTDWMDYSHRTYVSKLVGGKPLDDLLCSVLRVLKQQFARAPPSSSTVPLFKYVATMIFEMGTRSFFGDQFYSDDLFELVMVDFDQDFPKMIAGLPDWMIKSGVKARAVISDRLRANMAKPDATMSDLMVARYEYLSTTDGFAAKADMGSHNVGLLWAANANSIPTMYWLLYRLLGDKKAWVEICDEVKANLPKLDPLDDQSIWTRGDLAKLVKLDSAICEVQRLDGSTMSLREAICDTVIKFAHDGRRLKLNKGDRIALCASTSHFDPAVFPDPLTYHFDRFAKTGTDKVPSWAFNPFGGGHTMCPGRNFAKLEIKSFVAFMIHTMSNIELVVPDGVAPQGMPGRTGFGVVPPTTDHVLLKFDCNPESH